MKYCEEYAALLDAYVDGELPARDLAGVQSHLERCPGCRAYVDDALAIRAAFPEAEDTLVPEGFAQGVLDLAARTPQRRLAVRKASLPRRRSLRAWGGTAAAAACVVILLRCVLYGGGPAQSNSGEDPAEPALDAFVLTSEPESGGDESDLNRAVQNPAEAAKESAESGGEPEGQSDGAPVPSPFLLPPPAAAGDTEPGVENAFEDYSASMEQALRVEIPAEQGDLLASRLPLADEAGRTCYLLEREDYEALALALAQRNAAQPSLLQEPGGSAEEEALFVLVYLAE